MVYSKALWNKYSRSHHWFLKGLEYRIGTCVWTVERAYAFSYEVGKLVGEASFGGTLHARLKGSDCIQQVIKS